MEIDTTPYAKINMYSHRKRAKRTLYISVLSLINSILVGFMAKGMILLINFITQLSFFGRLSFNEISPAVNHLSYWVIAVPAIGGLLVGMMARYGSPAIRGHGIPEAMEKIYKGESKIHPLITILKPLSAAISIGSGGPFGAEGPIISTGGALGSLCGQTLHITSRERKILLAGGATAGMTAIFGTPFAAMLLAIELLLFEFSSRSFIPVMVACIGGASMHFVLFGIAPTFPMPEISHVSTQSLIGYAVIGLIVGIASVLVTKSIYFLEDIFERLPFHWMWWPALGGIVVGIIGTIEPATLGVGYQNITSALSSELSVWVLASLCFWKFVSWSIALGSGTSGGTLAPLLTIGSTLGCLLGMASHQYFPELKIVLPLAALVGMAALFAGASRALLTAIVFALETTMQEGVLLPLMAGCGVSYLVSFIFMKSTIMTEKISRRGITLPDSYHPDLLDLQCIQDNFTRAAIFPTLDASLTLADIKAWLKGEGVGYPHNSILILENATGKVTGTIDRDRIFDAAIDDSSSIKTAISHQPTAIHEDDSIALAVDYMLRTGHDILPVEEQESGKFLGAISAMDILNIFEQRFHEEHHKEKHIDLGRQTKMTFHASRHFFTNRPKV